MNRDGDDDTLLPGDVPHDGDLRALYRQLPPEEPRAEIDAAIRAAARRAVGAGPLRDAAGVQSELRWWSLPRWRVPAAVAATMLITLVIVREEPAQHTVLQEAARQDMAQQEVASPAAPAGSAADAVEIEPEPPQAQSAPVVVGLSGSGVAAAPARSVAQTMQPAAESSMATATTATAVAGTAANELAIADFSGDQAGPPQQVQAGAVASAPAPAPAAVERKREAATTGALAAMQEMRVAKQAASPAPALESDMPVAHAARNWPFGLSPAMSLKDVCAHLVAAGMSVAATCGDESGMDRQARTAETMVFVVSVRDSQLFLRDIDARLQASGWLRTDGVAAATQSTGYRYSQAADASRDDASRDNASQDDGRPDIFAVTVIDAGSVAISLSPATP